MITDTHAHVQDPKFDDDREEMLKRAREAGVGRIITIGTSVEESRQAVEYAHQYDTIFAAVGIHPHVFNEMACQHDCAQRVETSIGEIDRLAGESRVVAIGEVGFDFFSHIPGQSITDEQKSWQQKGFEYQVEIAKQRSLTLVVHCRDGYEHLLTLFASDIFVGWKTPIVLHCYMGGVEITKRFLLFPFLFFSFAGNCTYPVKKSLIGSDGDIRETIRLIDSCRLLCETDSPYLAPQSCRGTRNEPANVTHIVQMFVDVKGIDNDSMRKQLEMNTLEAFFATR